MRTATTNKTMTVNTPPSIAPMFDPSWGSFGSTPQKEFNITN